MKILKGFSFLVIFYLCTLTIFLNISNKLAEQGFGKQTTLNKIPSNINSGLIDIFFECESIFTIDEFQTASGVKLHLNIVLSTARDLMGKFWVSLFIYGRKNGMSA